MVSLPQSSSAEGLSVSLSLIQWSARGRRGWLGSTRSISFLRRSNSATNITYRPVGYLLSSIVAVASDGSGNLLVANWMVRTPCEKESSLLEYLGGVISASGGI